MDSDRLDEVGRVPHGGSDDPTVLDFSANVNPLQPDGVETVYREAFDDCRRYPLDPPIEYRRIAADYVGCEPGEVIPTPGGLAAIRLAIESTVSPGDSVLVPSPSFGEFEREVRLQGAEPVFVPAAELPESDPAGHALAIACTPNNPTGRVYESGELEGFARRCRAVGTPLLVDEAFLGFTDRPSLAGTTGTIVARSLTKLFGLPGLRAGFAVATAELSNRLETARPTWNVGTPALTVGGWCMRQEGFIEATRARVGEERDRMWSELSSQFEVTRSSAPFLLVDLGDRSVDRVLDHLEDHDIAVRDARTFRGLASHIRVAVRLPDENDRLLEALSDV